MAILASRATRDRRQRLRALTPAAIELASLLADIGDDPDGREQGAGQKRERAAALARHLMKEADDLRWDPRISEEFRQVLAHASTRLASDPRVRDMLRDIPPPPPHP
jgi:hypothetical protein